MTSGAAGMGGVAVWRVRTTAPGPGAQFPDGPKRWTLHKGLSVNRAVQVFDNDRSAVEPEVGAAGAKVAVVAKICTTQLIGHASFHTSELPAE